MKSLKKIVFMSAVAVLAVSAAGCKKNGASSESESVPHAFSVSPTKKVVFSPANLWAEPVQGGAYNFHFESVNYNTKEYFGVQCPPTPGQEESPFTVYYHNPSHISQFLYRQNADIAALGQSIGEGFNGRHFITPDFTVDGESGWRLLNADEFSYLLSLPKGAGNNDSNDYSNDARKDKWSFARVNDGDASCPVLVIAPDDWTGNIPREFTKEQWNAAVGNGAVCFPLDVYRIGELLGDLSEASLEDDYIISGMSSVALDGKPYLCVIDWGEGEGDGEDEISTFYEYVFNPFSDEEVSEMFAVFRLVKDFTE